MDPENRTVDLERQGQERNRHTLNLRKAGFPAIKRLEEFDFRHQTTITKRQVSQSHREGGQVLTYASP